MENHAEKHSLDLPHVAAVELPLIVKNPSRAIAMLGGPDKIRRAVNSQYRQSPIQPSSHSVDERNLELRLRNDPFHHPVQASVNRREKIIVKVRIPKKCLPSDYYEHPGKYTIRELLQRQKAQELEESKSGRKNPGGSENEQKELGEGDLGQDLNDSGSESENDSVNADDGDIEPVAIVNKNYSFRAMADFQMSTKNNATVQKYRAGILDNHRFENVRQYFDTELEPAKHDVENGDFFQNKDHKLIPPPHFSGVRFPFDYRYQSSPFTITVVDENGDRKVVMKSDTKKLFTNTVDYYQDTIPQSPLPEIVAKLQWLRESDLSQEYADKKLYECIKQLQNLFALKPIWLRKSLIDVVPEPLKSAVKEALPYVSYCYKNGPWRFCNVKLGVNPKDDKAFWVYQSEYFRLQGLRTKYNPGGSGRIPTPKVTPNTIRMFHPESDVQLSEFLFFTGRKLPETINFQIGDILDEDILKLIHDTQAKGDVYFFRDSVDAQDGWIKKQPMETIRRIIRYKLRRLQREESIDKAKLAQIIESDYSNKADRQNMDLVDPELAANEENDSLGSDDAADDGDEEDDDEEEEIEKETSKEENIMNRIKQVDERTAAKLSSLVGLIKQDEMMNRN